MTKRFRWLHLSDLHAGMPGHSWLWPGLKGKFLEDIKRLHNKTGNWDAVVFSGDLTQGGTNPEYDKVTEALQEIWSVQKGLGCEPILVAVPGNHDLVRPSATSPASLVLRDWWTKSEARTPTLTAPDSEYRLLLSRAFSGFLEWKASAAAAGLPFGNETAGLFPGDFSTTITTAEGKLGVVGLNSAWLQLDGGDFRGRLCVEVQQLLDVTANDPEDWRRKHDKSILVTHHPANWLHPSAFEIWRSEINPSGGFDAHLYGHMHDPDATSVASGGSPPRRSVQAASLFGLEKVEDKLTRINGYSVAELDPTGGLRVWPRINQKMKSGDWRLVADTSLDLDENESFLLESKSVAVALSIDPAPIRSSVLVNIGAPSDQSGAGARVLQTLRYHVPGHFAHRSVRRVEQRRATAALTESRALWLSTEWGAGSDGFIKSILNPTEPPAPIYKLDLADYTSREEFLDEVKSSLGVSLEQLCADLASEGQAFLILDNCPTSSGGATSGRLTPEADVEQMVEAILNFCPDLRVVLRSRKAPELANYTYVALSVLDEADVRSYVLDHENGGDQYRDAETISAIFRHTDGVPARVDATLRELEILPVDQLPTTNSDLVRVDANIENTPPVLRDAINDLSTSKDPNQQRAFALLKALLAFPHGETITRLHRFYGAQAIYPNHARELLDKALVSMTTPIGAQVAGRGDSFKLLLVPRPVRDHLRSILPSREHGRLTRAAADLYFGENWPSGGGLKKSVADKFAKPTVPTYETGNASSIIHRLLNEALDARDQRGLDAALDIAKGYISALHDGDHFRTVLTLARDLLARIPEEREQARASLTYEMGRALRMSGKVKEAGDAFAAVDSTQLPQSMKRSLQLSQALALQRLGDSAGAVDLANKLVKADRRSWSGLQAKAIILEEDPNTTDEQLRLLEKTCRKSSATVVANNLALNRAERATTTTQEASDALDEIIRDKDKSDFYNRVRAIVRKVKRLNSSGDPVSDDDKILLIDAYHFLYNERLTGLFDSCHVALWDLFVRDLDQVNLLRLFRHSSLIWRLRGEEEKEGLYLRRLAEHVQALLKRDFQLVHKETAYYLVRASAVLK